VRLRRAIGPTVAFILAVLASAPASASAHGLPISRCDRTRGTLVAVDFAPWGGPVVRGCALRQTSDYALLHAAGFATAGDVHDGPGFICRLSDTSFRHGSPYPTPSQQACVDTPSASAYWSLWLAPAGSDRWHYSQSGAMIDHPEPGEVELWTFGATNVGGTAGVPAVTPAELRSAGRGAAAGATEVRLVDAVPTAARTGSGSPVGLIVGGCVALALCAGAVAGVLRRRREA
jgi:hypothetical protein